MIIVITPTGDRVAQFNALVRMMHCQTVKPDKWIIVDDGKEDTLCEVMGQFDNIDVSWKKREHAADGHVTLKENMTVIVEELLLEDKSAKVIIMEDDDFYPSTYIEHMSKMLDDYNIVGGMIRKYYNLTFKGSWEFKNSSFGTFNSTGFINGIITPIVKEICDTLNGFSFDVVLWNKIKMNVNIKFLMHNIPQAQVYGIKGWKTGRSGAVYGSHRTGHKYKKDNDCSVLKRWFSNEDGFFVKTYLTQINK